MRPKHKERLANNLDPGSLDMTSFKTPGPQVYKSFFSCSTQLSMKFKLLINIQIAHINGIFRFKS